MACFVVPAAEAIVSTVVTKIVEKRENKIDKVQLENGVNIEEIKANHFAPKLKRLNSLLWGGSALLAFEHLWHGEIQPFFPFLTAAGNPADTAEMLTEMSTVGVTMAFVVTAVWAIGSIIVDKVQSKELPEECKKEA